MATAQAPPQGLQISEEELGRLLALVDDSDSVELKLTVPAADQRSAVQALGMDPLEAQIRQVFFFDTPDLALYERGVVARARRVQKKGDDSVVKLRPVVPSELPDEVRQSPNMVVEVDAMPGGFVCSASLKRAMGTTDVRAAAQGDRKLRKLFSKEQRAFFAEHAPEGIGARPPQILGPIFVLKLKFSPGEFDRRMVAEMWLYPDNTRILELSTKCAPARGARRGGACEEVPAGPGSQRHGGAADQDTHRARLLRALSEGGASAGRAEAQESRSQAPHPAPAGSAARKPAQADSPDEQQADVQPDGNP